MASVLSPVAKVFPPGVLGQFSSDCSGKCSVSHCDSCGANRMLRAGPTTCRSFQSRLPRLFAATSQFILVLFRGTGCYPISTLPNSSLILCLLETSYRFDRLTFSGRRRQRAFDVDDRFSPVARYAVRCLPKPRRAPHGILALRQQLAMVTQRDRKRIRLRRRERLFWVWLYCICPGCLETLHVFKADTLVR